MNNKTQLFISVASGIIVFDVVASFASRLLHFDYGSLMWVTFCLYMICGYLGFQYRQLLGGFLAGVMPAVRDENQDWRVTPLRIQLQDGRFPPRFIPICGICRRGRQFSWFQL